MQNKFIRTCAVSALLAVSTVAHAQLGNGGGTYADKAQSNPVAVVMPTFLNATYEAFEADARLLGAVGMADQAVQASARAKELESDSPPAKIEQIMAARNAAALALTAKLGTAGLKVEGVAKQQFGAGIDSLANAVKVYESMSGGLPELKKQLRDMGSESRSAKIALFIAKSLPQYKRDMKQELHAALTFARANGIAYAPAADALDAQ